MKLNEFIESLTNIQKVAKFDTSQIEFVYNGRKLEATEIRSESICNYNGDLSIHPGYKTVLTIELNEV